MTHGDKDRASVYGLEMAEGPWTDGENGAIVADYFAMLADDLPGRAFTKAEGFVAQKA